MQVEIAENVDGIGVGNVVNGRFARVEFAFLYLVDRMAAIAVFSRGFLAGRRRVLSGSGFSRIFMLAGSRYGVLLMIVLSEPRQA